MTTSRYDKYIVRKLELPAHAGPKEGIRSKDWINSGPLVLCDGKLFKEADSIIEYGIVRPGPPPKEATFKGPGPHKHDYDELFSFIGTNPDDVFDLGGEAEIWLGEGAELEKVVITTPSSVYIPAGLTHDMQGYRNVRRPFVYLVAMFKATDYVFNPPAADAAVGE